MSFFINEINIKINKKIDSHECIDYIEVMDTFNKIEINEINEIFINSNVKILRPYALGNVTLRPYFINHNIINTFNNEIIVKFANK